MVLKLFSNPFLLDSFRNGARSELWYLQENRKPAIFLCPYMGRIQAQKVDGKPFRFILNHSKAIAPNVYLMMYPKEPLKALMQNNSELIYSIWKALNSIPIQSLIHEGRVYGDGLYKLEPRELANAPADQLMEFIKSFGSNVL
jgi:adenine-specific DNA-methyltransferase